MKAFNIVASINLIVVDISREIDLLALLNFFFVDHQFLSQQSINIFLGINIYVGGTLKEKHDLNYWSHLVIVYNIFIHDCEKEIVFLYLINCLL